jgi:hypothetical protein
MAGLHAYIESKLPPKDLEKKQFGEVFTPLTLVNEMLDAVAKYGDMGIWSNPNLKILDPAAGIGNFPLVAYEKLMAGLPRTKGLKTDEERRRHILENMLYMVELNGNNVRLMKKIFGGDKYKLNIVKGDFLEDKTHKKLLNMLGTKELEFDLVMGNPPYQNGKNSNFYVYFIKTANALLKPKGKLSFLTPNRFLIPDHLANDALLQMNPVFAKHTVTDMNVSTIIGYFLATNENYERKTLCEFASNKVKFINLHNPTPTNESNYAIKKISDKILSSKLPKLAFQSTKPTGDYIFIKRQWERYSPSKPSGGGRHVFSVSELEHDGKYLAITSKKQKKWLIWYLTRCKVTRFITAIYATSMNVPPFLWRSIPLPTEIEDMSDVMIIKELELKPNEITDIDMITK